MKSAKHLLRMFVKINVSSTRYVSIFTVLLVGDERCEEQEKRVCMTIPQQECKEKKVPKCTLVPREECKMVPEEKCTEERVEERITPGQCRVMTRLECNDKPRQKCGRTVRIC